MIYRNSYFSKELRQAYNENIISYKRQVMFALFLGLVSFAIHFIFQTLTKSVLSDAVPEFMQPSYFSTIYTYINVAFISNVLYLMVYYDYLSFTEIKENRWYLLVKMGYEPLSMIFSKLIARLFNIFFVYTIGFLFTILMTVFLKYNFIYKYFPALYITGLIDLIVVVMVSMTASLYLKYLINARYFLFFSAAIIIMIKVFTGYYSIVSNRILMQNIYNLFDFAKSLYLPLSAVTVFICIVFCILKADSIARYYRLPYSLTKNELPGEVNIVLADQKTGLPDPKNLSNLYKVETQSKVVDIIVTTILIIFVCTALLFNVMTILISTSQPGKEVTIFGQIPYVFKTATMQPTIMENDLAYFRRTDSQEPIGRGEVVIFTENNIVYIERVISIEDGIYIVDIDNYPPMAQEGAMIKKVNRDKIYGVYTSRNRWLGALILFSNTIIGRFIFLLIPAVLLFFYKPIISFFSRQKNYLNE